MSWNGNDNNKDPWGRKDGPPDIDEAIDQFKKKLGGIFGGSGGSGPGFSKKNIFSGFILVVLIWVGMGIYQVEQAERLSLIHI